MPSMKPSEYIRRYAALKHKFKSRRNLATLLIRSCVSRNLSGICGGGRSSKRVELSWPLHEKT